MKISTETLNILKNFAAINKGILINVGNVIRTRTDSVFAEATIPETFPMDVGIFDLNNLLNIINLFDDPEFEFGETGLRIAEANGLAETLFGYAGAGLVALSHPKKLKQLPENVIEFLLTEEQWSKLQKATSVFQKPEINIVSDGKVVRMGTMNHKQQRGNSFSMILESDPGGTKFNMIFAKEHLALLKGTYTGLVTASYTVFKNVDMDLTYYIGVEPTSSTFGE